MSQGRLEQARTRFLSTYLLVWLVLGVATSCASPSQTAERDSDARFPSAADLSAVADPSALMDPNFEFRLHEVEGWPLEGPLPSRASQASQPTNSGLQKLLVELARPGTTRTHLPAALHCLAREYARFFLELRAYPSPAVATQFKGACGVLLVDPIPVALSGSFPKGYSVERLLVDWRDGLTQAVNQVVLSGHRELGIALVRGDGFAVVVVVGAKERARIEDLELAPDRQGRIRVRGRLLVPAGLLSAHVTRGRFDAAPCVPDPAARLPDFDLRCEVARNDATAWIRVNSWKPEAVLGDEVVSLWIRRKPRDVQRLSSGSYLAPHILGPEEALAPVLLDAINQVRGDAGRAPLELERNQSQEAASVAPAYFAAQLQGRDPKLTEVVALGLMAGWEVPGPIRSSQFTSATMAQTRDVGRWLSQVLRFPGSRVALLDPKASAIAIGTTEFDTVDSFGVIAASYTFFTPQDDADTRAALLQRIAEARKARGLPAARENTALSRQLEAATERAGRDRIFPSEALHRALKASAENLQRSVEGLVFQVSNAEQFVVPARLLRPGSLEFGISVSHFQPENDAWGRYVILLANF